MYCSLPRKVKKFSWSSSLTRSFEQYVYETSPTIFQVLVRSMAGKTKVDERTRPALSPICLPYLWCNVYKVPEKSKYLLTLHKHIFNRRGADLASPFILSFAFIIERGASSPPKKKKKKIENKIKRKKGKKKWIVSYALLLQLWFVAECIHLCVAVAAT